MPVLAAGACRLLLLALSLGQLLCLLPAQRITRTVLENAGSLSDKMNWHGYQRAYPKVFGAAGFDQSSEITILEIGFGEGNSVPLWESVFPRATIVWVDYTPGGVAAGTDITACLPEAEVVCNIGQRSRLFYGDQADEEFLQRLVAQVCKNKAPCFDLVIDDGGHGYNQQMVSFRTLFPALVPAGVYVIEDVETSYFTHGEMYGEPTDGGRTAAHTPVNIWKRLADSVNYEFHDSCFEASPATGGLAIESQIQMISFSHNMLVAHKVTERESRVQKMMRQRQYRYAGRVAGHRGPDQACPTQP